LKNKLGEHAFFISCAITLGKNVHFILNTSCVFGEKDCRFEVDGHCVLLLNRGMCFESQEQAVEKLRKTCAQK